MVRFAHPKDGHIIEGTAVEVQGPRQFMHDFPLADGSKLRITFSIGQVIRANYEKDELGYPVYGQEWNLSMAYIDIPDEYLGPVTSSPPPKKKGERSPEVA